MDQKKENKSKPKKYWNKIIWSNLAFSYSLIFLILTCTCWQHAFAGDINKFHANLAFSCVLIGLSLASLIFFSIWNIKKYQGYYNQKKNLLISLIGLIPFSGCISTFVYKTIENKQDKDRKKYSPSAYVILFFLILFVALLIWIVYLVHGPIMKDVDHSYPVPGLLDVIIAPINGFIDAADLIVFLLVIGGFLQVVNTSKSIEAGVSSLIKKMKGKEIYLIPILMLLFSIGGTTFGMCEETLPFYLIITPILVAAGFDTLTAVFTILFGAGLGVAGSILNPFVIAAASDAATKAGVTGLETTTGIAWRVITYLLLLIVGIACVTIYAIRVKKNPMRSVVYDSKKSKNSKFKLGSSEQQYPLTGKRKAILAIFGFTFLLMIVMVINWKKLTGFTGFDKVNQWLIDNLPFFASGIGAIGTWYLPEMSFLFLFSAILIGILTWTSEENFLQTFFAGSKDFFGVAVILAIARGLSLILTNSGVNSLIVDGLAKGLTHINAQLGILIIFIVFIGLSFLIPSTSGFAGAVFPIIGPTIQTAAVPGLSVSGAITGFSLANGFVNLFSPTAGPFVAGLALTKTPIDKFYKGSWKILLVFLLVMLLMLLIGTVVPTKLF